MHQLTGLDAAFLALDSPTAYGHIGNVSFLNPLEGSEALTLKRLTEVIESRLRLVPPFRRRLVEVPMGLDHPYWIEDPDFDIEYHVRELALAAPGDDRQLAAQVARLHARPLDRRRPLWETYLIHGMHGGKQALYVKFHHAAVDGVSGNDLLAALMDTTPQPRAADEPDRWRPEAQPRTVELLLRSAASLATNPVRAARISTDIVRSMPALISSPARPWLPLIDRFLLRRDPGVILSAPPLIAPATPFNKNIGPHRRWAFTTVPLAEVKAIKNAAGVSVNDVVMALCAGALRTWLQKHDVLPEGPLVAAVPVSIRTEKQQGTYGNRISFILAPLPTHLADAGERLAAVHEAMRAAKEQHNALPAELLTDIAQFSMPALANQANRLATRLRLLERVPPFNVVISNVPGPAVDFYLCGTRVERVYPLAAVTDGHGINLTVLGSNGKLNFAAMADPDLVPDVDMIIEALQDEVVALSDVTGAE